MNGTKCRYWAFALRQPHDAAGTEPHQAATRVPARKTRFGPKSWLDEAAVRAALITLLSDHLGQPVTVGDHSVEDACGHGYVLKVLYYAQPLDWESARVDATYVDETGCPVTMPWV